MKCNAAIIVGLMLWVAPVDAALTADLSGYRAQPGLSATQQGDRLQVAWEGADRLNLRLAAGVDGAGVPTVFAIEYQRGSNWVQLAHDLKPNWSITTGQRREGHGLDYEHRWDVFWDAPLSVPGPNLTRNPRLPRTPEEVARFAATFKSSNCSVKTDGARLEITFPGVSMGIFAGDFRITVYRGSNLLREEVIARTDSPSVAYIYSGGFSGLSLEDFSRVEWRDVNKQPQKYMFDGPVDKDPQRLIARNRVAVASGPRGSIAVFPPPHIFFFARESENNVGYVWHQKVSDRSFSLGVRQNENAESYRNDWNTQNWSLYNAPPGTQQRMSAYFLLSPDDAEKTRQSVMAYTYDDHYKPIPGYKAMATHFHTAMTMELMEAKDLSKDTPWMQPMRDIGLNIVYLCDFHSDGHPSDPGPVRLAEQKAYYEAVRKHWSKDFIILPGEEPNAWFAGQGRRPGHYNILFPKPVYWTLVRGQGQPFVEEVEGYGKVYHTGSSADVFEMLKLEDAIVWQTHPRTKDSTGYPDAIKDTDFFKSDHFLGAGWKACPTDFSQKRLADVRAFGAMDDMNNWGRPKYFIGEVDTYKKFPDYDLWGDFNVNYVKLDQLPPADDFKPIESAIRKGDFFVSTGEVLIPNFSAKKVGDQIQITADVQWTFPLEFVEVVWGDGQKTDRQVVSTTDLPQFGSKQFTFTIPAASKKWVRFAAWDSAVNGAFTQPVHFQ